MSASIKSVIKCVTETVNEMRQFKWKEYEQQDRMNQQRKKSSVPLQQSAPRLDQLLDIYYRSVLEMRTDWLALQAFIIAFNTTGNDGLSINRWRR